MKRIYFRPITETSPVGAFQLLNLSNGRGPSGADGELPSFGDREVELVERGDNTRTQLWEDPDASNGSGVWN